MNVKSCLYLGALITLAYLATWASAQPTAAEEKGLATFEDFLRPLMDEFWPLSKGDSRALSGNVILKVSRFLILASCNGC